MQKCKLIEKVEAAERRREVLFAVWGVVLWLLGATLLAGGLIK